MLDQFLVSSSQFPEWPLYRVLRSLLSGIWATALGRERTLAIGMYPAGASAQGVHDLAGNVWEWRMNQYNTPSEKAVDGSRIDRVVRGGSWYNAQHLARADGRYNHHPDDRYDFFGFRVVCASPII